ncbi:MAG: hypothetical protein FJ109_03315 [Deltaproteobacteria bacterium]|nr:hypothetical protein [Deltaproteobacteria bacterium]
MSEETKSGEERTELDILEDRLRSRTAIARWAVIGLVLVLVGGGLWAALTMSSYSPPEPEPVEELLVGPFSDLQLEWFDSLSLSARVNKRMESEKREQFRKASEEFLSRVREVDPTFEEPFRKLTETMAGHDQVSLIVADPYDALKGSVGAINDVLAKKRPRFLLDVEPFEGLLDERYLMGGMICTYEVLDELRYGRSSGGEPADLLVVRRRDYLPADSYRHGFVRRKDANVALVLQDNATAFAADYLFPSFERPDAAFERRFGESVDPELKAPYRVMVELAQLELKQAAGADDETFRKVVSAVARRSAIYQKIDFNAGRLGVRLKRPDGLLWPRTFPYEVQRKNTEANKRGERLIPDDDRKAFSKVSEELDDDEANRILAAVSRLVSRSVGFHEARHVYDIRDGREAGACIMDRVHLAEDDPEFLRDVDMELRAHLTQMVESPETIRLTLITLLSHLYQRSGTAYFYAARTLLHPLAWQDPADEPPHGIAYAEELTLRLAALEPEELKHRSLAFWKECFGEEYSTLTVEETAAPEEDAAGCSGARW